MTIAFACVVLALTASLQVNCLQDIPERGRHGRAYMKYSSVGDSSEGSDKQRTMYVPRTWNSKVDNFDNSSNTTFSQRFFENDLYWKSNGSKGPVFLLFLGKVI